MDMHCVVRLEEILAVLEKYCLIPVPQCVELIFHSVFLLQVLMHNVRDLGSSQWGN